MQDKSLNLSSIFLALPRGILLFVSFAAENSSCVLLVLISRSTDPLHTRKPISCMKSLQLENLK